MINSFKGECEFLSNFYPIKIYYMGFMFPSSEHAYQASKTFDYDFRAMIAKLPKAGTAKWWGSKEGMKRFGCQMRKDWDREKDQIMFDILIKKFDPKEMRNLLIQTGEEELIEGNYWHDNYWGDCYCQRCNNTPGKNKLGEILMNIREILNLTENKNGN